VNAVLNHLWQSTAFAAAVAIAAALLRRHSPRLRYWLWLTASAKFLVPFSLLIATGARVRVPPDTPALHAMTVQWISTYFSPAVLSVPARTAFPWTTWLAAIWTAGALFLLIRWLLRWRTIRVAARQARKSDLEFPAPVFVSATAIEPGVFGILRPILLLPEGLPDELTPAQFEAILAHELRHIRFRDNLTAALHMFVEALFWFHPLVWWLGARLTEERERDCDEAALRQAGRPADYARGIVSVCRNYAESPLPCASGITGSDLGKRIREIMTWSGSAPLTKSARAMLWVAALTALSLPIALGILRAQSLPPAPVLTYDAVSIHKTAPETVNVHIGSGPQGGWSTVNTTAVTLISTAYNVRDYQIIGAPAWAKSQGYDVIFTPDKNEPAPGKNPSLRELDLNREHNSQRMQAVLRDRFALVLRSETRELPIYNLTQAKGGHKLSTHDPKKRGPSMNFNNGRQVVGVDVTVTMLAQSLAMILHRPVVDETHINGQWDFKADWTPDSETPANASAPGSIFTEINDKLGLKLQSAKGPVQVYVVEKIDQPEEN
jgi:uncharacterized protein (TIGR03435 family)